MIEAFIFGVRHRRGLISTDYQSFGFDDLQRPQSFPPGRSLGKPKTHRFRSGTGIHQNHLLAAGIAAVCFVERLLRNWR
jgi:hypothetical protein